LLTRTEKWAYEAPSAEPPTDTRTLLLGFVIIALTAVAICLHVPGSIWVGTLLRKDLVVALMLASAGLWAIAVARTLRRPSALLPVIAIAIGLRLLLLFAPPFMSSDVYRYVWDGKVQAAGINPYAYIAADPVLASLRDTSIYPRINRVDYAHTIYPPAAQIIFAAVGGLHPTVTAMKCAMLVLEACGIAAMLCLLNTARLPLSRILIYAWNPLPAWAIALDGHIDGAMIGLLGAALLAACARYRALSGALLGAAILTKFFPVVVAPALWRRWDWKFPAACAATIAALYALYASVGWRVLGFLPAYTQEEGLRSGHGFWLLGALDHIVTLPHWSEPAYLCCVILSLATLAIWITFLQARDASPPDPTRVTQNVALLATGTMAAMSAHYPWYFAWLALPACLVPWPSLLWLSAAPLFLYCDPWHDEILIPTAVFVPFAILAARDAWRAWPRPHPVSAGD
jgi:hypothetical protein